MNLYLFGDNEIIRFILPLKKIGNFWMSNSNDENIINIKSENNEWIISGSENVKINGGSEEITLKNKTYYEVVKDNDKYLLFADWLVDNSFSRYKVESPKVQFGTSNQNNLSIPSDHFKDKEYTLDKINDSWKITVNQNSNVYLNNSKITETEVILNPGDEINVNGFRLVVTTTHFFMNNPFNNLNIGCSIAVDNIVLDDKVEDEEISNDKIYKDEDYFLISPRIKREIEEFDMSIDSPPKKEVSQEIPLIYTLGPMLTMGASSMVTLSTSFAQYGSGEKTFGQILPTLIISLAMFMSMLVWPFLTKKYEAKTKKKREEERQEKYKSYLEKKRKELYREYDLQKRIYEENLISCDTCYDMILNKRRTLWSRKMEQNDFLTCRIGSGEVDFKAKISYQKEDFTLEDDNLRNLLDTLINNFKYIDGVPIGYSFSENNKTAISGIYPNYVDFTNNLLLQFFSFYSYDKLKVVVFSDKKKSKRWNYMKESPYCFSEDKSIRYFATNTEEMQEVSNYLNQIFENRKSLMDNVAETGRDYSKFNNYYLILIDDIDSARKIKLIENILEEKKNLGFSILILEEKLSKLPSQVTDFITIGEKTSVIISSDSSAKIRFYNEITNNYNMNKCMDVLENTPIYIDNVSKSMPNSISFLELYGVGQVEQLNALNRWKNNDSTKSLKTEIGIGETGDLFLLDLHEKQHGPHGLVAGMTGSGKSEFIITYVLSMAVNYSPEEVAFVLIDYKGGGLAGAFVNSETGEKLPHVVGTITNLDKAEINRALSSINSELRRRQTKFNEVRDSLGESTVDIYKYQKLYREGIIDEPIPHLIIVCDEFAELKDQQPDFMDDLISTARIGRSLGVHLILATQKPTGVVDAQIWSNSKFKICLKVQDKQESMEMIKRADAAELKNVGRFYLQVGYNEYFAMGQSAWAGAQYYPSKEYKKPIDKNLYFIDNIGEVNKSIYNSIAKRTIKSEGEELTNILKYLISISKDLDLKVNQLWLDKIPANIYIRDLYTKYNYQKTKFNINPIIGEYDDPENQRQGLLTLPITQNGNVLLYGMNDSGKDEFLQSLIYSTIMTYDTSEINLYLLDFGAETLMNFGDAPQVGNVIVNGDDEKLENFIKMITSEMDKRKKLFMSYNGNYQDYIKLSGRSLANIVVIINSVEVMSEVYMDLTEKIIPVIREGSKYGINFVITTVSQNTVKFKIAQSCKQLLCLQLNNDNEYRDILGKTNGIIPTNSLGRGLVKLDKVCEFQTAFISEPENVFNNIKELITSLEQNGVKKAKKIPVMPDIIKLDGFTNKYLGINSIPLGLTKDNLLSSVYDYSKNVVNIISSDEIENIRPFLNNYLKVLELNNTFDKIVVDGANFFENFNSNIQFINNDFNGFIDSLKVNDDSIQKILNENNMNTRSLKNVRNLLVVIVNFEKFYSKLDDSHKTIFKDIMSNNLDALKINFVFIDIPSAFKKYEYEDWYKKVVNTSEGLWIGSGVTQQFVLKMTIQPSGIATIDNEYGILIKKGVPSIIKLINEIK